MITRQRSRSGMVTRQGQGQRDHKTKVKVRQGLKTKVRVVYKLSVGMCLVALPTQSAGLV